MRKSIKFETKFFSSIKFSKPITFPYWETHIEFKISGHGKDLFGDGMAIWYVRHPMQLGMIEF